MRFRRQIPRDTTELQLTMALVKPTVIGMIDPTNETCREVLAVHSYWQGRLNTAEMTVGSVARYERVLASFVRFIAATGCASLTSASGDVCKAFVFAPRKGGQP